MNKTIDDFREFLKENIRLKIDFSQTSQSRGLKPPPIEKPFSPEKKRIKLTNIGEWKSVKKIDLESAISQRRSIRKYSNEPLLLEEVSFLLWATQGIQKIINYSSLRTVPSAGARHAFETYLCVLNVTSLEKGGIYRYLPIEHELLFEFKEENLSEKIVSATLNQSFTGTSAVVFVWSTIPYRMEWRYLFAAHKSIAIDVGHVCQNLYLACEAIGAGTCAIAAYDQNKMDNLLRLDGKDEFTIYLAPVGKI